MAICGEHVGMAHFAQTLFELGQTVPVNQSINPKYYLLGRNSDTSAFDQIADSLRQDLQQIFTTVFGKFVVL